MLLKRKTFENKLDFNFNKRILKRLVKCKYGLIDSEIYKMDNSSR